MPTRNAYGVKNGYAPKKGPLTIPVIFDFSSVSSITGDMFQEQTDDIIDFVQSLYIDNSLSNAPFTITFPITGQKITCPPNSQGMFPAIISDVPQYVATCTGGVQVTVQFMSVPMPLLVWGINGAVPLAATIATGANGVQTPAAPAGVLSYDSVAASTTIPVAFGRTTGIGIVGIHILASSASPQMVIKLSNDGINWGSTRYVNPTTGGWVTTGPSANGSVAQFDVSGFAFWGLFQLAAGTATTAISFAPPSKTSDVSVNNTTAAPAITRPVAFTAGGSNQSKLAPGAASGVIKASQGQKYGHCVLNTNAAIRYLQIYNKITAGIPGTDTPAETIPLGIGGMSALDHSIGTAYSTGISWAVTTDAAGATPGAAGDIVGTVYFF